MEGEIARSNGSSGRPQRVKRVGAGRSVGTLVIVALLAHASAGSAQDISIDRWLVTGSDAVTAENPLAANGNVEFPDRDLEIGPGEWTLVRSDGQTRFDFSDLIETGQAALAHTYVRALGDANVLVSIDVEACASVSAWVNGQPLLDEGGSREVRLAGGWNTLFAVVDGDAECPRWLSASISESKAPRHEDAIAGLTGIRIQASQPPGVRPNYPEGTVSVGGPTVSGLVWSPGRDDLDAVLDYSLTAWGRGGASDIASRELRGPPAVDLTGDWDLTLYGPTGIQLLIARFEMAEDGTLTGELRRDRREPDPARSGPRVARSEAIEGRIRDGWVSGARCGWTIRVSGQRGGELTFTGQLQDGALAGSVDFGGFREFDSRFEARRGGGESRAEIEPSEADPVSEVAQNPRERTTGPSDPDGRRRAMVALLLGDTPPKAPAPADGSLRLKVAGESLIGATGALVPATPYHFEGILPFRKVREAALQPEGVEAQIRWDEEDLDVKGRIGADGLLEAFHGPITLGGLVDGGDGVSTAVFRIPDVLGGFALRGSGGQWRVDGSEVADGVLCDPCQRGRELEITFRPDGSEPGRVELTARGYPDSAASGPTAVEWLRALEGDNRKYRELSGG